jgi:tetratricopeptide (TPR) repeat protein
MHQPLALPVANDSSLTKEEKESVDNSPALSSPAASKHTPDANTRNNKENNVDPIKPKSATIVDENFRWHENIKSCSSTFPAYYIADLKVINYSSKYSTSPDILGKFETGVRSQYKDMADQADAMKEKAHNTREITYERFLEKAVLNYKKGNYDDAIDKFNLIQSYFPNDLNAMFYSGLSYFRLNRWNLARARFAVPASENNNAFYEEAKWYEAQTEIKQNKMDEAKALLRVIIREGGFYKEQAQGKLAELK